MQHPDEGLIHAWLDGELDVDEAARVESLVAGDRAWAAMAAEARGLIAASARIAAALDGVPGHVTPKSKGAPRAPRWWMMRAAAMLVVGVGTIALLRREGIVSLVDRTAAPQRSASEATPASVGGSPKPATPATDKQPGKSAQGAPTNVRRAQKSADGELAKRGDETKAKDALGERAAATGGLAAMGAATATSPRPASPAPVVAPVVASAVAAEQRAANEKVEKVSNAPARAPTELDALTRSLAAQRAENAMADAGKVAFVCFRVRQPADSADRILRFRPSELTDSVRAGRYRLSRDSLVGVNSTLVALALRCAER